MKASRPPRLAEALLALRVKREFREFALGDLAEEYSEQRATRGWLAARLLYWWDAVRALLSSGGDERPSDPPHGPQGDRRGRRGGVLESIRRDALLALRSFARSPIFTAAAIVTLALGIGATTVAFSFADAVLFRPIPGIEEPEDVAIVRACGESRRPDGRGCLSMGLSYPNLHDVASRLTSASGFAGETGALDVEVVVGDSAPISVGPRYVSPSYFEVLGMQPRLGRTFSQEEVDPAVGAPVALISYRLWTTLFHRSPDVLGETMLIGGHAFTVIGVAAQGFHGTSRLRDDLWLPGSTMLWVNGWEGDMSDRGSNSDFNYMVARRHPGVSWEQVEAELDSFSDWLAEQYPEANAHFREIDFRVLPGVDEAQPGAAAVVWALLAVVGLILLIACSNVANLLVIKGLRRRGEVAVRKALGASSRRLIGQHLTESVTLWLIGGAVGTGLAFALMRIVDRRIPELSGTMLLDLRVLTFAAVLSLGVGLAFGALPALAVARVEAARWLGQATSAATSGRGRLRGALSAVQLAATLMLLVGALLTNRALGALSAIDLGFNPDGVTVFEVGPGNVRYDDLGRAEYYREMLRRLRSDPAVEEASLANQVPFVAVGISHQIDRAGESGGEDWFLGTDVGPRYFDILEIPILAGRAFTSEEYLATAASRSIILGAASARRLFGDADPLGELVEFPRQSGAGPRYRVVGVAADVRFSGSSLREGVEAMVYRPFGGDASIPGSATIMVRARSAATELGNTIRTIAAALDEDVRVTGLQAHEDAVSRFYGGTAIIASLSGWLALLAALLAAVGLYGVVGVAADERLREFGIRVALGADSRSLLAAVAGEAAGVVLAGLLLGMLGSFALGIVIESFLYGVSPLDPLSWALAALLLGVVAALAILGPARRAITLDPVEVLRAG
jgi:predicted permease